MGGYQGSDLLNLLVVGDSFSPKQQAKTAGMACQGGSSKMLSMEVSSPLFPSIEPPQRGAQGLGLVQQRQRQSSSNTVLLRATAPFSLEMNEVVSACPDVQAYAKGRVETCQAHSLLQEIRLDKNKLSLLFF